MGDYGQQRRLLHAATFGRSDVALTLLRMEEHAFYLVVIKLIASVAVAFPERLSPEQRVLASTLLALCPMHWVGAWSWQGKTLPRSSSKIRSTWFWDTVVLSVRLRCLCGLVVSPLPRS